MCLFFCFKQKTAYEMRISDWSSDVCSSDLECGPGDEPQRFALRVIHRNLSYLIYRKTICSAMLTVSTNLSFNDKFFLSSSSPRIRSGLTRKGWAFPMPDGAATGPG